jgi:hypothetical protein
MFLDPPRKLVFGLSTRDGYEVRNFAWIEGSSLISSQKPSSAVVVTIPVQKPLQIVLVRAVQFGDLCLLEQAVIWYIREDIQQRGSGLTYYTHQASL